MTTVEHCLPFYRRALGRFEKRWAASATLCLALCLAACDQQTINPSIVGFTVSSDPTQDLLTLPYPNDLRLRKDGTIDFGRLSSGQGELVQQYLDLAARNKSGGFSTNGAAYFRFSCAFADAAADDQVRSTTAPDLCSPVDLDTLPQAAADSLSPSSTLIWANIDKASPEYGEMVPVRWAYREKGSAYISSNYLAIKPLAGFVLLPKTKYAVMITDGVADLLGDPVQRAGDFEVMLQSMTPAERFRHGHEVYADLRDYLQEKGLTNIAAATVFTTGDPTRLAGLAREVTYTLDLPQATDLAVAAEKDTYWEIRGSYSAPFFQAGTIPFKTPEQGGEILLDDTTSLPTVAKMESMRFALSLPKGAMPPDGWPIVLYAHGTGGDFRSFLRSGVAKVLAQVRDSDDALISQFAVIGIDQSMHGARVPEGTSEDLAFFNVMNMPAAVDNVVQGGIDGFSLLRMVEGLAFNDVPWLAGKEQTGPVSFGLNTVKFDASKIYFMGHSQGGLTGPIFLAHEPKIKTAVLSGAGGSAVIAFLDKTKPFNIGEIVSLALNEDADEFHPVLNFMQQALEPADTNNYGIALWRRPNASVAPKNILLTQGLIDHYTPLRTSDSLATAIFTPHVYPSEPLREIEGLRLRKSSTFSVPVAGNIPVSGGAVTVGLLQYEAAITDKTCKDDSDCSSSRYCDGEFCREDGHFVAFDIAAAIRHYSTFLGTMARDGVATIMP